MLSCVGVCLVEEDDDYGYTAKPRHPYLDQILRQREDPDYYDGDDLSIPSPLSARPTTSGSPLHRENRENDPKDSLSGKTQGIWKFG